MPKTGDRLFDQGVLSITYISSVDVSTMSFDVDCMHGLMPPCKSFLIGALKLVSDTRNRKRGLDGHTGRLRGTSFE